MSRFYFLLAILTAVSLSKRACPETIVNLTYPAPTLLFAEETEESPRLLEREFYDTIPIFNRKRNAHACMMSIVFLVLYPLGANASCGAVIVLEPGRRH